MGSARDDLAIRGGFVVDGTGTPGREADVVVRGDRIVAVGPGVGRGARRVIDARDRVVAPGFIDIHTHSDFTLPLNPRAEGKIRQGVTTEVVGNCGFSVAPALPGKAAMLGEYLAASAPGLEFRETTFAEYLRTFPPTSVNTVMQVGHNTLRLMTVGMARRAATPDELGQRARLLEEALDAGRIDVMKRLASRLTWWHMLPHKGTPRSTPQREEASHGPSWHRRAQEGQPDVYSG